MKDVKQSSAVAGVTIGFGIEDSRSRISQFCGCQFLTSVRLDYIPGVFEGQGGLFQPEQQELMAPVQGRDLLHKFMDQCLTKGYLNKFNEPTGEASVRITDVLGYQDILRREFHEPLVNFLMESSPPPSIQDLVLTLTVVPITVKVGGEFIATATVMADGKPISCASVFVEIIRDLRIAGFTNLTITPHPGLALDG